MDNRVIEICDIYLHAIRDPNPSVRVRLEWEYDTEIQPLSFAIREPCSAAEKEDV